ncbi:MAG: serine/threonine-protein kinase [Candidatus Margulisiibacteriota bacterium]|nr:serine/threonine-protein kinase [Candidatus Margulisiibacteriota bacterium]
MVVSGPPPKIGSTQIVDAAKQRMGFLQRHPRFRNALLKWAPAGGVLAFAADRAASGLATTPESLLFSALVGALVTLGLGWMVNVIGGDKLVAQEMQLLQGELEAERVRCGEWETYAEELNEELGRTGGEFKPEALIYLHGEAKAKYKVIKVLGEGAFAVAVLVHNETLGREEVLKCYHLQHLDNENALKSFDRECMTLAGLSTGNLHIPEIYEYFSYDPAMDPSRQRLLNGRPGFSMQYVKGEELTNLIRKGRLSVEKAIGITLQIIEGLEPVHAKGVIHRDLKPDNIKITKDGKAYLLDFGIAKAVSGTTVNRTQQAMGTPEYMSVEQWDTTKGIDGRTDQYSIGVILWEMLHGVVPFPAKNINEAMHNAFHAQIPEIGDFGDVTAHLKHILTKMLARDAGQRYPSLSLLKEHLKKTLGKVQAVSYEIGNEDTRLGPNPLLTKQGRSE